MTFYALGGRVPSGTLPGAFKKTVYTTLKEHFTNLVPTTYDASKAYLDQELLKPKGQRDLHREMCMLIVMQIPKDQDILLIAEATKTLIPLTNGELLIPVHVCVFGKCVLIQSWTCAQAACYFIPPSNFLPPRLAPPKIHIATS